jgi:ribosomal protein L11 methyltransferase
VYCDAREAALLEEKFRRSLETLARRTPKAKKIAVAVETVSGEWTTAWAESLRPVRLTRSFVVCPGRSTEPDAMKGTVIRLEPGLVFGYGEHPTTRMAAKRVEAFCRLHPGCSVLDFGSGSGVLAIVAALSGGRRIVGLDVDPVAVRAARANAKKNGAICNFSAQPVTRIKERFDCVIANVDAKTLVLVRDDLARVSRPAALLLLTGFLSDDAASIQMSYASDFDITRRSSDDSWILLELRRRARNVTPNVTPNVTKVTHSKRRRR